MIRRSAWRPRSWAFVTVEAALAWIGASYGFNLVFATQYKMLVTPATIAGISHFAPLAVWGWSLTVGALLLVVGLVAHSPAVAFAGHVIQVFILAALGYAVFQIDAFNQVFLVLGLVLHPTMAATVIGDATRTSVATNTRK
jgi:hypothetical protein